MIDRTAFFAAVRKSFGALKQAQVNGFTAILDEWEKRGLPDIRWLAYMLATTWHETAATMQPIREFGRGRGKKYGTTYYGRGFVQLTWDYNYRKASTVVGIDLVKSPDRALELGIATAILFSGMIEGWFTSKKLADYINSAGADYKNARRVINGTDRAQLIAGHAVKFEAALSAAGGTVTTATKPGLVVGDSIAVGTGEQLGGFETNAKEGIGSGAILERVKPGYRYYIISAGSNDSNMGVLSANLRTLAMRTEDAQARVWILPSPANAQTAKARKVVADLARELGDRTVDFTAGQDGIHPLSYKAVARDVMTVIRTIEAQPTMSVPEDIPVIVSPEPRPPPPDVPVPEPAEPSSEGFFARLFRLFIEGLFSPRS